MAQSTETAWQILRVIALALPAYAILFQVYTRLTPPEVSNIARQYAVSFMALIIMGPMMIAGVISTFKIHSTINDDLISVAILLVSMSFLITPVFLVYIWRSNKALYDSEFPEKGRSLSKASERWMENHPTLSFASYLLGLLVGIFLVISPWGIWFKVLGSIQIALAILLIVVEITPDLEVEEIE